MIVRPEEDPADPVLALSRDDADEVPDETPEDDLWPARLCEKGSREWSPASPHRTRAPFRESMEGVGELISPDFCLTIPWVPRPGVLL